MLNDFHSFFINKVILDEILIQNLEILTHILSSSSFEDALRNASFLLSVGCNQWNISNNKIFKENSKV